MVTTPTPPATPPVAGPIGLAGARSPALDVPLRYMLAGVTFFVAAYAAAELFAPAFLSSAFLIPALLIVTHLAALGWFTMVAMGALFQLVPVVLEVPLFSERLAKLQFYVYLAGVLGLIFEMGWGSPGLLAASAGCLVVAVGLFLYNMSRTLPAVRHWPITGWYIQAALVYLGLLVLAGFTLALNLQFRFLPVGQLAFIRAHAHLGALGWLSMLLMGVSYKLTPMFALTHPFDEWRLGRPIFVLMQLLIVALFVSLLAGAGAAILAPIGLFAVAVAGLFACDYATMVRRRRRRPIDLTMKHNMVSVGSLVAAALLGTALLLVPAGPETHNRLILAYAYVGLGGWVGFAIVGQLYKILPFLVWTQRFGPKMGRERVPLLRDMYPLRLAELGFWLQFAALLLTPPSIAFGWLIGIRAGFGLGLAGAAIASFNLWRVVFR